MTLLVNAKAQLKLLCVGDPMETFECQENGLWQLECHLLICSMKMPLFAEVYQQFNESQDPGHLLKNLTKNLVGVEQPRHCPGSAGTRRSR